jgi:parvulin-like peptidyl-prolyl isomerase
MRNARAGAVLWLALALPGSAVAQSAARPAPTARDAAAFAIVGDQVITVAEYRQALNVAMRRKYYHARPPEHELPQFKRDVGDDLVNRVLLVGEARRRGLAPDRARIDGALQALEARYRGGASREASRATMLAAVRHQLEADSLLEQLEQQVRQVRAPGEQEAQAFYEANRPLFVEPEQVKLSVILLKVEPSAPQATWAAAQAEAQGLHARLLKGADFADIAKLHSGDLSAGRGGDMGYLHRGMLPESIHAAVDALRPGAISPPVTVLEGVAILRLDDRRLARQRAFAEVRERAGALWQRAESNAAWQGLIAALRSRAAVRIDESNFLPLARPTATARPH